MVNCLFMLCHFAHRGSIYYLLENESFNLGMAFACDFELLNGDGTQ